MKKIAIIGASYLQNPLILKAKEMGLETHVFAWGTGDVGEKTADFFYPISITEVDEILERCQEIGIDGITTIASDLATRAVGYVANAMGLAGNSLTCVEKSTNKELMRKAFYENGDPSPKSVRVTKDAALGDLGVTYPVIVKPSDRSGSRGITKLESPVGLETAIAKALEQSFSGVALVEEYARGREYSVEYISYHGIHRFLTITEKFTTGAPHFIETAHLEPGRLPATMVEEVKGVVSHALDSLGVTDGASHSEIKISADGAINIIEIGARMGGDCIGSDLVRLSTGYDFTRAVIDVAMGTKPRALPCSSTGAAAVRYVFNESDIEVLHCLEREHPDFLVRATEVGAFDREVVDSGSRFGSFVFSAPDVESIAQYLPTHSCDEW